MTSTSNTGTQWRAALALGALLGASVLLPTHATAADTKGKPPTVSAAMAKPLQDMQKSVQAKDWPAVISKGTEAANNPKKTPYDQHIIDEWMGFAYAQSQPQDWLNAAKHFEATLNDGFLAAGDVAQRTALVTQCYFNAGIQTEKTDKAAAAPYLDKAIEYGTKSIEAGGASEQTYTMVVNGAYVKGDYKTAAKYEQQLVDSQVQKGQEPSVDQLDMLRSSYFKMNDNKGLFNAFKTTLAYHPTSELWEQAISIIAINASRQPASELQLYRLMLEAKVLKRSNDYTEFADTALRQGSPGEAKSVLEKGFAANVFSDAVKADNKKLLQSATTKGQSDQASLPGLTKDAQANPTGQKLHALGFAYFGYGQYDKASELLNQALAKGGLQNEADTRLLLGISQLKAGHPDDAAKTFQQVKGNESLEQIAQLWPLTTKTGT